MSRATLKDLGQAVEGLNRRLKKVDYVGGYGLKSIYDRWQLVERLEGGAVRAISSGFRSKADLLEFILGIHVGISLREDNP